MGYPDTDIKGYYATLGVSHKADTTEIKAAFRAKAKEWHPDTNKNPKAKEQFQRINEAYQTLSDSNKRAEYDALGSARVVEDMARAAAAAERSRRAGPPGPHTGGVRMPEAEVVPALLCTGCGQISTQPRYVIVFSVTSIIIESFPKTHQGVYCRACADRLAVRCSIHTWLFGWWAVWGIWHSVPAILKNLTGGDFRPEINAEILGQQAAAFATSGQVDLARPILVQALRFATRRETVAQLKAYQDMLGPAPPGRAKFKDRWGLLDTYAFWVQLVPVALVGIMLLKMIFPDLFSPLRGPERAEIMRPAPAPVERVVPQVEPGTLPTP